MPTIDCSLNDLCKLVGRKLSVKAVEDLLEFAKAGIESSEGDLVRIKFEDTNQPYLWSTEGVARLLRGILDVETGLKEYKALPSKDKIIVDKSIEPIRPYIAAFSTEGRAIDDDFIKQLIQFQEKLCEGYGMRRKKVSIGIYKYSAIKFPVTYKAVVPASVRFVPLEHSKEYNLAEILEVHETGRKYSWTLAGFKKYPILMDSADAVLSFPPIINSANLGKIEPGDKQLLVELTGDDASAVDLVCNIMACAFLDRGWKVSEITIESAKKKVTPTLATTKAKMDIKHIASLVGLDMDKAKISKLLEKMRYGIDGNNVVIPCYRADILHPVDIAEDVLISYGYNLLPDAPLETYTVGDAKPIIKLIDPSREILVGMGYQEVLNAVLSSKELIYSKMNHPDTGTVELKDCQSANYSILRSWIMPLLIEVVSLNKHNDYPQNLFEQGEVSIRKGKTINDQEHIAFVSANADVDYTKSKQVIDSLTRGLGCVYKPVPSKHPSFVPGRCCEITIEGESIGTYGEIHPAVLDKFEIRTPVIGGEINLSRLYELLKK